jgi:hypothetical protein
LSGSRRPAGLLEEEEGVAAAAWRGTEEEEKLENGRRREGQRNYSAKRKTYGFDSFDF